MSTAENLLNNLIVFKDMKIHIFNSRYSEGVIGVITRTSEQAEAIEDQFTSGDQVASDISGSLNALNWFPIVHTNLATEIIPALIKRIETIFNAIEKTDHHSINKWCLRVELVGNIIEQGHAAILLKHHKDLNVRDTACQEELLFLIRDHEI